jgi:class 3 adenylate cyclase
MMNKRLRSRINNDSITPVSARSCKIVAAATTESRVRDEFRLKPIGSLDLKNIGGPFDIYEVRMVKVISEVLHF